jgi:UDP-N-acetylmuramoyl-tripeptide--D-alanyl-D-alanine ligase
VINDAYNASPASASAALKAVAKLAEGRRLIAVLGQMNELGSGSSQLHVEVDRSAVAAGVRYLIGVGNADAELLVVAAARGGVEAIHVPDAAAARPLIRSVCEPGDVVLFKGSNGGGLSAMARELAKNRVAQ